MEVKREAKEGIKEEKRGGKEKEMRNRGRWEEERDKEDLGETVTREGRTRRRE